MHQMNEILNELQLQGFLEPAKWLTSATNLQSFKNAGIIYLNQSNWSNMSTKHQQEELETFDSYQFKWVHAKSSHFFFQ